MRNHRVFGAVVGVLGVMLPGCIGTLACARRVADQLGVSIRNSVSLPQSEQSVHSAGHVAALSPDAGVVRTISAASDEPPQINPLEARILNPYDDKATVSSPPPTHHVTANFEEDLSLDLVNVAGSVGREVWFKAEA